MSLQYEINATLTLLKRIYIDRNEDKHVHDYEVAFLTKKFKHLLAQKARKEAIDHMGNDDSSDTEDTCTCEANDPRPSICVRDILKQKITGCG